jgi:hypothetical protein
LIPHIFWLYSVPSFALVVESVGFSTRKGIGGALFAGGRADSGQRAIKTAGEKSTALFILTAFFLLCYLFADAK